MTAAGTVITRFRLSPGVVSTTYAVITLVTDPIGRLVTDERDHRSLPVAATAISAHRDRTAASGPVVTAGPAAPGLAAPGCGNDSDGRVAGSGRRGGPGGGRGHARRYDQSRGHGTRGQPASDPHRATSKHVRTHTYAFCQCGPPAAAGCG